MQVRFGLKMALKCWDKEFLSTTTIFQKSKIGWPQQPLTEGAKIQCDILLIFKKKSKHQNKVEFKNLDDSEVLSSNCSGLRTCAASLTSSASATTGLKSLKSPISPMILMVGSSLTPKWPILAPFCGMDHQKFNFSLISDTLSVGGCWGKLMLLFWKNGVVVPINSLTQHSRTIFKPNLTCLSLSIRANS